MDAHLLPVLPCLCSSIRRASRALTQMYELALRPVGLRATQFTVLQFLSIAGERTQGEMGEMLALDSTTLTRTLGIMKREGWIEIRRGDDGRERWVHLSKSGETLLNRALPLWENVQSRLRQKIGTQAWGQLMQFSNQVTDLVLKEGDLS